MSIAMSCFGQAKMKRIETNEFYFLIPDDSSDSKRLPLIVTFSPGGNAMGLVKTWEKIALDNNCALLASKVVRNGTDISSYLKRLRMLIKDKVAKHYPIKPDCIIAGGVSGGGMAAHLFSFLFPDTVAAVISNVGYIHENSAKRKHVYPKGKVCVFLTSPTDFNYKLMKEDEKFLQSLEWATKWMEFEGGHKRAPLNMLDEAVKWVLDQNYIVEKLN